MLTNFCGYLNFAVAFRSQNLVLTLFMLNAHILTITPMHWLYGRLVAFMALHKYFDRKMPKDKIQSNIAKYEFERVQAVSQLVNVCGIIWN